MAGVPMRIRSFLLLLLMVAGSMLWLSCERPTAPENPNGPPDTRLANVPKEKDTVFALVNMSWTAGDNDGFVTGYQYRYLTYHLAPGSTTNWVIFDSTAWHDTVGTSATIAFNSTESLNMQRFLVRAIDNDKNTDPTPAERVLYTLRTVSPITTILWPKKDGSLLVDDQVTDWWQGVPISFKAIDPTGRGKIVEYAWSVDDGPWTWQKDTSVFVTPDQFKGALNGRHKIKVISRNNTNLTDPVGDSAMVTLILPSFSKNVIIIDETDEFNNPFISWSIADSVVDRFYSDVFPGATQWDFKTQGMPPREVLADYKLIVWHADDVPTSRPHKISEQANIDIFTDYLKVGGKFLMSGWRILKSFAYYNNFPFTFTPGTFVYDYLHIRMVTETDILGDMTSAKGKTGSFTSISVDSARLANFPYDGKLSQVNLITTMAGFTDVLYSYENDPASLNVTYRGRAVALRYYGTVYDAVVLGFPMYFIKKNDAKVMAQEILRSLHVQ
jgi:hypothetical protein